jgi:hypothetical protein
MKKLYAEKWVTSDDKNLLAHCDLLKILFEAGKLEEHKLINKQICDALRRSIGITKVVGLGINKEKTAVGIFIYEIEAKDDVFYDQEFDEEEGKHFILVA